MAGLPPTEAGVAGREPTCGGARLAAAIDRGLGLFEGAAIAILLVALVLSVFVQVVSRYIVNVSNPWTEESARYFFVWVSMLGAALGVQRGSHFGFDAVVRRLPPLGRRAARLAGLGVVFGMAGLIAFQGWRLVELGAAETGPATNVPMPWVYAAMPLGGVLIMIHVALSVWRAGPDKTDRGDDAGC